jgi:hypothetical protein
VRRRVPVEDPPDTGGVLHHRPQQRASSEQEVTTGMDARDGLKLLCCDNVPRPTDSLDVGDDFGAQLVDVGGHL